MRSIRETAGARATAPLSPPGGGPPRRQDGQSGWQAWGRDDEGAGASPEERLAELGAALGPLRRVQAALAERLRASRAWERLCYARPNDYARERLGISNRQVQELARVDRALAELPALEHALLANALPWSKVRLVARVATAESEAVWIERARAVSTRQLEQEVRALADPSDPGHGEADDAEPQRRVAQRCAPAVRERWERAREVAERVAGRRLREADALEIVAAEVTSTIPIDPAFAGWLDEPAPLAPLAPRAAGGSGSDTPSCTPRARAPAPPPELMALAAGLDDASAHELDRRMRHAIRLEQTLDTAIAALLRRVVAPEYEWSGSYHTLSRYAREQLGMSPSKARALLRLERAADVCPALRRAYRSGRLSWVKAQCLLPLLLLDIEGAWRPAWVAWAQRVTVRRLEADVARALLLRAGHRLGWQRCMFHPQRAQDPIPPGERQMCAPDVDPDATCEIEWRLPYPTAALFLAVRETVRLRLQARAGRPVSDGEAFDALLDCALVAWTTREPGARRPDPVFERDGWRCAVPGCSSRANLHGHHVRFRSAGGSDEMENRVTLCAFHHQRCLHAGLLRVTGRAPDALIFELGVRPEGPPLARYRSGDVALPERGDREQEGSTMAA